MEENVIYDNNHIFISLNDVKIFFHHQRFGVKEILVHPYYGKLSKNDEEGMSLYLCSIHLISLEDYRSSVSIPIPQHPHNPCSKNVMRFMDMIFSILIRVGSIEDQPLFIKVLEWLRGTEISFP